MSARTNSTPSIYITEAQNAEAKAMTISQPGEKVGFSVTAAKNVGRDTHVTLAVRPELPEAYNQKYGRTCVMLEDYEFEKQR